MVGWQSRELVRNLPPTSQFDCYSLGMVLFYCLAKREHPFRGRTDRKREQDRSIKFELLDNIPGARDVISSLMNANARTPID